METPSSTPTSQTTPSKTSKTKVVRKSKVLTTFADLANSGIVGEPHEHRQIINDREFYAVNHTEAPKEATGDNGKFMYVTSHALRRSVLTGAVKHCKIVLPSDLFRALSVTGLANGVTWDEMLRAVILEHSTTIKPFGSSVKWLPQPDYNEVA